VSLLASFGTGLFWHGLGFIAETVHGFSPARNLALFAAMGGAYVLGAFSAGPLIRRLERRASPRSVLLGSLLLQALACTPVAMDDGQWTLWTAALVVTVASSITWPVVESYLAAGRHGAEMRRAIAAFNFTWMPAVAAPMFIVGPFMDRLGADSIAMMAPIGLLAAGVATAFPARPGRHDPTIAAVATGPGYRSLLRSARILLPLSYVLTSAMSPLLPFRFRDLGVAVEWATPATTSWMAARITVLLAMWRWPGWHGRWDVLLGGGAATIAGFAGVMLLPGLPAMLGAFVVFGAGLGVVYYAALYYGLAVGHADVDAGGTHEGLIGVGYCLGPLVALAGVRTADIDAAVGILSLVAVAAAAASLRPWLADRRRHRAAASGGDAAGG
jgi:MFS family permease